MENNSNTEIDLWKLMFDGFTFFKKRKWVILSSLLIGTLFGLSNFITHPLDYKSFYKKDFIAQSSVVANEVLSDIINNLSVNLNRIPEFKNIKGKLEANSNEETRLKITIEVYEKEKIDSVVNAVASHLGSIENLRVKYNLVKEQHLYFLSVLNKKISELDSTKKSSEYLIYIQLLEKKQSVEKELTLNKIVDLIEINSPSVFVSNNRVAILNVLGYSFLGIIIGFITGFMLDIVNRKK